jgi:hypothetical protein
MHALLLKAWMFKSLFVVLVLLGPAFADDSADRGDVRMKTTPRLSPTYKVQAGVDGEIYPVFANYASLIRQNERSFGVITVTIANHGDTYLRQRITVRVAGWSDQEIQIAELPAGEERTYLFAPAFLPRFYQNHEIAAATAAISIADMAGHSLYETTAPVRLRSSDDMYWGNDFKYAPFIASWVTPHDARVEAVLARAKNYLPDHRLPGYENWKNKGQQEQESYREAQAIFTALKLMGLSYVKSSTTFGDHKNVSERIRMPRESLDLSSANCIDAVVMYASLFENLGMDATVAIVPGHAYVGVRVAPGSQKFLFIDVALTGRATFEVAVASAEKGMAKYGSSFVKRILIQDAREAGIYPLP